MSNARLLQMSAHWFRFVERLYPPDFTDEMGIALVEAYMDGARYTLENRGRIPLNDILASRAN